MDGRGQRRLAEYLTASFGVGYLDMVTTAGLVKHLAADTNQAETLLANVELSMSAHGSSQIAVAAHHDCAGNSVPDETQKHQVGTAMARLRERYADAEVVGLWLNDKWIVERVWL